MSDIEKALNEGLAVRIKPHGNSMYPFIRLEWDEVVIEPYDAGTRPKRGEAALYRRDSSILVLHRVFKTKKDNIWFAGDNQCVIEGPLSVSCVKGRLTKIIRKKNCARDEKVIRVTNPAYRFLTLMWLYLMPVRKFIRLLHQRHNLS